VKGFKLDMDEASPTKKHSFWSVLLALLRQTGVYIVVGLGGALLLLYLFAELTEDLLRNEFTSLDDNVELWVHSLANPVFDLIFNFFTTLGGAWGITVLTAVPFLLLLWKRHFYSGIMLALSVLGGLLINFVLKELFQRPRPELWESTFARPTSFSFPSGHATLSLCLFGMYTWIFFHLLKSWRLKIFLAILMAFTILMIGLSRIYFGVHYPTDVVGGYLSGGFWLSLIVSGDAIFTRMHLPRSKDIIPPLTEHDRQANP
jgi:membrane-associated phospholipid phosphatase